MAMSDIYTELDITPKSAMDNVFYLAKAIREIPDKKVKNILKNAADDTTAWLVDQTNVDLKTEMVERTKYAKRMFEGATV
jgi:hypothetical protein